MPIEWHKKKKDIKKDQSVSLNKKPRVVFAEASKTTRNFVVVASLHAWVDNSNPHRASATHHQEPFLHVPSHHTH